MNADAPGTTGAPMPIYGELVVTFVIIMPTVSLIVTIPRMLLEKEGQDVDP